MNKTIKLLTIFGLLFGVTNLFASGGNRIGTAGAQELLIPVGAASIALNGANMAYVTGVDAIYYNPAGLSGSTRETEASFSSMSYIADINFIFAGLGVNIEGVGSIGLSLRSLDVGDIPETTEEQPGGTGSTFSPSFIVVGLTYSNFLTDRIRAGINFNLINESIMSTSISLDAGIQYDGVGNIEGLMLGVVLRNFGSKMSFTGADLQRTATEANSDRGSQIYRIEAEPFELPSQIDIGLAYRSSFSDNFSGTLSSSFQNNNFLNDQYKFGLELNYDEMLYLRGGYTVANERAAVGSDDNIFGPSFGAGFVIQGDVDIIIDYAFQTVDYFSDNQVFGLKVAF